jgi:UDP-N-acetylmuramoyl-tripeptide--D-alanyl-D-alanine ligase
MNEAALKRKPLARWTLAQVAAAVGGEWRLPARSGRAEVEAKPALGAALDSRQTRPGEVFVALPGERADGHDFIPEARAHGAVAALCRRDRAAAFMVSSAGRRTGPPLRPRGA